MHSPGINGEGELRGQLANPGLPGKWSLWQRVCVCRLPFSFVWFLCFAMCYIGSPERALRVHWRLLVRPDYTRLSTLLQYRVLSLHEPGSAGFIEAKHDGGDGDNWSYKGVQSSSQIITNKPTCSFLQAGCPSCHPTNSVKALKGNQFWRSILLYDE